MASPTSVEEMEMEKEVYTIGQAARYCKLSRGTLWRSVKSGALKASSTPGGHFRISRKDLETFMLEKGLYPLADRSIQLKRILIAAEDTAVQKPLVELLAIRRYETEIASDGFETGIKLMRFRPALVVLERVFRGTDGFELCLRIKADQATRHIFVIAVSTSGEGDEREQIVKQWADGYFQKPIDYQAVLRRIDELVGHDREERVDEPAKRRGLGRIL